jgi:ATP phosphoribosyltransferase
MSELVINITDVAEMKSAIIILQLLINKSEEEERLWTTQRKQKKKKKTVDELIKEIEEDIEYENHSICDSNIEIENLELKRAELEKMEQITPAVKSALKKIIKKRPPKKVTTEFELLELIPEL